MLLCNNSQNNLKNMILESDGQLHPIEVRRSANPGTELANAFKVLDKATVPRGQGAVICLKSDLSAMDSKNLIVPIWMI